MATQPRNRRKSAIGGFLNFDSLEVRNLMTAGVGSRRVLEAWSESLFEAPALQKARPAEIRILAKRDAAAASKPVAAKADAGLKIVAESMGRRNILVRRENMAKKLPLNPKAYKVPGLRILAAKASKDGTGVVLWTSPQKTRLYALRMAGPSLSGASSAAPMARFVGLDGSETPPPPVSEIPLEPEAPAPAPPKIRTNPEANANPDLQPWIVGAISLGNTEILVQFSEPMAESAVIASRYEVSQETYNAGAGHLLVSAARFASNPDQAFDRSAVVLTTSPQNELTYLVTASAMVDLTGQPIAPQGASLGTLANPTRARFKGTPAVGVPLDTDGDGLSDNEETRGYVISITAFDGTTITRGVSSNPYMPDTDGDGLDDYVETESRTDPRSPDSDSDVLTDYTEWMETFSNAVVADTDGDGIDDGSEYLGFLTSPNFADTDGDQMSDSSEINTGRNPRVSDLPQPVVAVSGMNLTLDVRLSAVSAKQTRVLDTKTVSSSLESSNSQENSIQWDRGYEVGAFFEVGSEPGEGGRGPGFISGGGSVSASFNWTTTATMRQEMTSAYEKSLTTDRETTRDETVQRDVIAGTMRATLNLKALGSVAFRLKNLQVTAFISDPQNPGSLTPIATLIPDAEPEEGYTVGPLVGDRGPIIVSNTDIYPSVVESLLSNPRGLVFQISNYDVVDEADRNFGFTSQEISEKTGSVVFDYGGAVADKDGKSELLSVETFRVATTTGRPLQDTDGNRVIDAADRRSTYNAAGKMVGITLRDALNALGLTHYTAVLKTDGALDHYLDDDGETVTSLTDAELRTSFATTSDADGARVYRMRNVVEDMAIKKYWRIVSFGRNGLTEVTPNVDLDSIIVTPESNFALSLLVDLDQDLLPANVEHILGTMDTSRDTDGDGLDDRFEAFVGWVVNIDGAEGTRKVYSSPTLVDSDRDGISDLEEAPSLYFSDASGINRLREEYSISDSEGTSYPQSEPIFYRQDINGDMKADVVWLQGGSSQLMPRPYDPATAPLIRLATRAPAWQGMPANIPAETVITDPMNKDTDADGLTDFQEIRGFKHTLLNGTDLGTITTSPSDPDTDGDTAPDGLEVRLGGNPNNTGDRDDFADDDRDGLVNIVERQGWVITVRPVSTAPLVESPNSYLAVKSDPQNADSDGDGVPDGEENLAGTVPGFYIDYLYSGPFVATVRGYLYDTYVDGQHNDYNADAKMAFTDTPGNGMPDTPDPNSVPVASPFDTDLDGLTDLLEIRGFILRDLGVIKTDPTDADTDNDMLSDGAEADLNDVVANRWIVRAVGQAARRVWSSPIDPDADFDGLVDGEERLAGTDPANSDTDGDTRDDLKEVRQNLDPLVADHKVTVVFQSIRFLEDGDSDDAGEISYRFGVRKPDSSINASPDGMDLFRTETAVGNDVPMNAGTRVANGPQYGDLYYLKPKVFGAAEAVGAAVTFSMLENQRFSINGVVQEGGADDNVVETIELGGYYGTYLTTGDSARTERPAIFSWDDIKGKSMHSYFFDARNQRSGVINEDTLDFYVTILIFVD